MKLRYFFDPGSGVCLWASDEEARDAFGYSVELERLPLPERLITAGCELITWFNTSIDWDYPPNPSPWSPAERTKFMAASDAFYSRLVAALGTEYELANEA
ncbi:hypothetical protein [Allohahella sp. A8]|uniref:hypothetical protein n=1 Tax=Allohahella sp. A8 TaxID=3141461 RepID=UPI003A7FB38E